MIWRLKMKNISAILLVLVGMMSFAGVIESLTPNGFATDPKPRLDRADRFEFRLDEPAAAPHLKIRPQKFQIRKGSAYWIEPTVDRPFEVIAEKDGELILKFSHIPYQWIGIFPAGKNLLSRKHLSAGIKTADGAAGPLKAGGMLWEKSARRGLFRTDIEKGIGLTPGKMYRLTFGFHCERKPDLWGAFMYVGFDLTSDQGERKRFRVVLGNRIDNDGDGDGFLRFTVPANWKSCRADFFAAGEFGPMKMIFTDFDLREAPVPMRNHPRHHGTANQYPPKVSEKTLLKRLAERNPYEVKITRFAERPVLEINGKIQPFTGYSGAYGPTARMFDETGYPVAWVPLRLAAHYRYRSLVKKPIWKGRGQYDFSSVDEILKNRLLHAPDQPLLLAVALYPYPGFTEDFPDAVWREHDGSKLGIEKLPGKYFHSITGEIYRREVGNALFNLGEYLRKSPYGKNVIGIHITDGGDGQWYDWTHSDWQSFHFDYSEQSRRELCYLLRKKYNNNIEALRQAWQMPKAEFDTLQIPKPAEWKPFFNTLMDPAVGVQKRLIDFGLVYEDALVHTIDTLLGRFKEGIGRNVIGTVYFPHDSTGGLIRAKNIDGILSVPFYGGHRALGSANFIEQPAGSFRINDKMLLTEIDHRSDYSELGCRVGGFDRYGLGVPVGPDRLNSQLRRDFAMTLTQGEYCWILTIAGYNTWSEKFYPILPEYLRAARAALDRPEWYDWGAISFIADLKSKRNSGRSYGFGYNTTRMPRKAIMNSGVGFSDYLVSDIGNGRLRTSKIYIFADNQNLTAGQVEYIRNHYQKNGNILVFTFATGLNTPGGFEDNIRKLTGMTVRKDLRREVLFQYADKKSSDPLAVGFGQIPVERGDKVPLFYVDDPSAVPLAWHESAPELPAAAVKRHKDWTAVYLANGWFSPEFPRALAKAAGLVPTGPLWDVTMAGNSIIMIHAAVPGMKTVHFPAGHNLIDLENGQICAYKTDHYTFSMKAGETRWFKVRK